MEVQKNSCESFHDECVAERERGYDDGNMESMLVQNRMDHLEANHAVLQNSHVDLQDSHADLQMQVMRLQEERGEGSTGENE